MPRLQLFKGRKLVIATMHQKERVIAPPLERHLGVEIIIPKQFNSDKFGTFTREIKRAGNQLEAARKKAFAAMAITGVDLAVANEGSFDAHPSMPFLQSNFELVLLVDKKNEHEVRGHHRSPDVNAGGQYVTTAEEAIEFARKVGFPEHGVIIRRAENDPGQIYKDVSSKEDLIAKVSQMLSRPRVKRVFLEVDLRAHKNPTRMQAIEKATEDLIKNILSFCPQCQSPGFVAVDFIPGLKCILCGLPTELPLYEIFECGKCGFSAKKELTQNGNAADPQHCANCNP